MKAKHKAPCIKDLRLFDTCVTLGRLPYGGREWLMPDNVLQVMDKYDVAEALVHHNEARQHYPRSVGNELLLRQIDGMPRLHPVWVLEPPPAPDPKGARMMVEEMLAAGVKAARLMMGAAPPLHWLWKDLCEALEEHRVPCLLDFAASRGWASQSTQGNPDDLMVDQIRKICLAHPDLQMILSHVSGGLGLSHAVLPLMHRVPNLHLDITSVIDYWRKAATQIGPGRVFFGTGMPFYDPAILVSNVQYCHEIDDDAKRKICGDNLRLLLEGVR